MSAELASRGNVMNIVRRFTLTLVGIAATCVLSAGAASARVPPIDPVVVPATAASVHAHSDTAAAERARQVLAHKAFVARGQDELDEEAAVAARSRVAAERPGVGLATLANSGHESTVQSSASHKPTSQSGNGVEIALLVVTALAGLALGAAGSSASRRLRNRYGLAA
jgi:hypothetical protein